MAILLYVGGSGPGNYTRIQDAINASKSGDTVFVYSGTYYENVCVNKTINLIGQDKNNTIIDSNGGCEINIMADFVQIRGFTLQNGWVGIRCDSTYGHSIITGNNILYHSSDGILIGQSNNNTIIGNNIDLSYEDLYKGNTGIEIYFSNDDIISGNNLKHCTNGILVQLCGNTQIIKNNFIDYNDIPLWTFLFVDDPFFKYSRKRTWDGNYWDDWIGFGPKIILGVRLPIPPQEPQATMPLFLKINFDWHPARTPYDIGGVCMKVFSLFVIMFLLVSSLSISVIAENYLQVRTIYVDDDNTEGPWDGTHEHPFQYIQDGVNVSVDGDTVFVHNGTYYENIVITKSIVLFGEDVKTTIIYGSNKNNSIVVHVSVNGFTILGFTIKNGWIGISLGFSRNNNTISGNNIINNLIGIGLSDSSGNTLWRNTISNNTLEGIGLSDSSDNRIIYNTISNNDAGIFLYGSSNNTISGNIITNYYEDIELDYSLGNTISDNIICNSTFAGINLLASFNNNIHKNNFLENNIHAIFYNSYFNSWKGNYWDDWTLLFPKPIYGTAFYWIPLINFDWHPAKEPYDIP